MNRIEMVKDAIDKNRATDAQRPVEPVVMASVTGQVKYDVRVTCPHCKKTLHLNQYPYDDDREEYSTAEDELGAALFGFSNKPAEWQGLSIEYKCCGCKGNFTVGQLET